MEGENENKEVQEVVDPNEVNEQVESTKSEENSIMSWIKSHLVVSIAGLVGVIAVIIAAFLLISSGPKSAVKDFCKAFAKMDGKKVVKTMDLIGTGVWSNYDDEDFDKDDYKDFIKEYKDAKKEVKLSEAKDEAIEGMDKIFDLMEDEVKSFSIKVKKFKDVEKLGKNLYKVEAKVDVKIKDKDGDKEEKSDTMNFIVYKNKIIYFDGGMF